MAAVSGVAVWLASALLGRWLLRSAGIRMFSMLGGEFVFGYGILGIVLLFSVRMFGLQLRADYAILVCVPIAAWWAASHGAATLQRHLSACRKWTWRIVWNDAVLRLDSVTYVVILSWVGCVALVYWPLLEFGGKPTVNFPEIFDLPKQLSAVQAAFHAKGWPASNPFFYGEPFTYNLLFYLPPAFAARAAGSELAAFQQLSIFVVAVALALPLTVLDITRAIVDAPSARLTAALLATWVGGLTPLLVKSVPAIGYMMLVEGLLVDGIWVDETFISAIFVPQHLFGVLCALVSAAAMASIEDLKTGSRRLLVAACATSAGGLASLILLPHLLASFGLVLLLLVVAFGRAHGMRSVRSVVTLPNLFAVLLPALLLGPFIVEARSWGVDAGKLLTVPTNAQQFLYALAAFGLVVPLSVVGLLPRRLRMDGTSAASRQLLAIAALLAVGVLAYLFAAYPDAGIKSGLWLRIVLVVTAAVGLHLFLGILPLAGRPGVSIAIGALFLTLAAVNTPAISYYIHSARRALDPSIQALISTVRTLPASDRVAFSPPDQVIAAMMGRQVDFDFSALRSDSYLPPGSRQMAASMWSGVQAGDAQAWQLLERRYDYLVTVEGSPPDLRLSAMGLPARHFGGYRIYPLSGRPAR